MNSTTIPNGWSSKSIQSLRNNLKLERHTETAKRPHFEGLDGLRGMAIIIVVARHCLDAHTSPFKGWKYTIYENVISSLGLGVVSFFVLSGFLITGILLDYKGDANYYTSFFGRRVLRIFPLYYGTIFLFAVAYLFHCSDRDNRLFIDRLPWLLTYTSNIRIALYNDWSFIFNGHSLGHFWSLAVEEQFYLIWPFIIQRFSVGILKNICLIAILGGFIARSLLLYGCQNILGALVLLPCQSDALAMGALFAILVREWESSIAASAWPLTLAGGAVWMGTLLDGNALLTTGISGFGIMTLGAIAFILYHPISKWFSIPILRAFGKYSYGIYVLHVIILPFVWPLRAKLGQLAFLLFFIPLAFCTGWVSWHLFEVHFLKLKRFFPMSSKQTWTPNLSLNHH